jgi:hypothetical protein
MDSTTSFVYRIAKTEKLIILKPEVVSKIIEKKFGDIMGNDCRA